MRPIRHLAFVVNRSKEGAPALVRELARIARAEGVRYKLTSRFPPTPGFLRGCDACCAIGGDGTLLGVAREAALAQVPIIGVNCGNLGFLTTFSAEEARAHFAKLLGGALQVDPRKLIECSFGRSPGELALNDVLVKDEVNSRLVRLEVHADGELVTDYLCDGLIFSTPTGSTAYNLSAGGPILHPSAGVIAMTPICPHTLSNRAIIFRDSVRLRVVSRSPDSRLFVAIDGRRQALPANSLHIDIAIAKRRLLLAQHRDYSHFSVIRKKLMWSGGFSAKR
ncbi:MAG: NAD(+)/NADH kinase [Verrucomicrobia bacterium]|nr:NAD(+)/NADH kinase [Verrucomicrobiota bacterium]